MNILITGGAGFIGSHLVAALLEEGHAVSVIDDLSTGRLQNIAHLRVNPKFMLANASINNEAVLDRMGSQADVIVHLAAAVGVQLIVERPVHTIETNIMGTEAVLQVANRYQSKVILASTSEVYGKGAKIPFAEQDDVVLGPTCRSRWSYAATKMVDEFLALAYAHEYQLPVVIVRLFNTVGPRQTGHYGMVIPRFMRQAIEGKPITVYGDGTQRRCFCDVSDAVSALLALMKCDAASGQVFNVGNTEEISMQDLACRVKEVAGSSSEIRNIPYAEAYAPGFEDMERRVPDTSRINKLVGWKPNLSLQQILVRVHDYMRENPDVD